MEKSIVFSHIRKNSVKHFILPIIPIVLATLLMFKLPYRDVFWPENVSSSEEAIKAYDNGKKYIVVSPSILYYSGYDVMSDGKSVGAYYYDISANNRCIFYLFDEATESSTLSFAGEDVLVKFVKADVLFDNMLELLSTDLNWDYSDLKAVTYTVILQEAKQDLWLYHLSFIALVMVVAYGAFVFLSNLIYAIVPVLHPSVRKIKRLMKYDSYKDLFTDLDYQVVTEVSNAGGMYITEKYFIHLGNFYVNIVPLSEIVFVYKHGQIKNFPDMHFKIRYTFHIIGNKRFRCSCPEKNREDVELMLEYFRDNYPDIINGYSDENRKLAQEAIKKNKIQKDKNESN